MCCAGLRWAVLSRPGVRGTTDDGADEQRVGQVESHWSPGQYDGPALRRDEHAQDQACDAADDINLDTTCPPRVPWRDEDLLARCLIGLPAAPRGPLSVRC